MNSSTLLSNATLGNFTYSLEEVFTNVLDRMKLNSIKDSYISNIGSYAFMRITEIDKNQSITENNRKIRIDKIKKFLLEESKRIYKEQFDNTIILVQLQEAEYNNRRKIDRMVNGVE